MQRAEVIQRYVVGYGEQELNEHLLRVNPACPLTH